MAEGLSRTPHHYKVPNQPVEVVSAEEDLVDEAVRRREEEARQLLEGWDDDAVAHWNPTTLGELLAYKRWHDERKPRISSDHERCGVLSVDQVPGDRLGRVGVERARAT